MLEEDNRRALREVLEAAAQDTRAPLGSNARRVGDFYASCMAEQTIEAEGLKPLAPELARIEKIKDQDELQDEIAHLHDIGINALFIDSFSR